MAHFLLGLTTTPGSDWHEKVTEIDKFDIEQIALFPTCLNSQKRQEIYGLLEKSKVKSIPHVHLRNEDMGRAEIEYLRDRFDSTLFNIHATPSALDYLDLSKDIAGIGIYIENSGMIPDYFEKLVKASSGICFDFAHCEDHYYIGKEKEYRPFVEMIDKYNIGCCHISAVGREKSLEFDGDMRFSKHHFDNLDELDYIKRYVKYLPEYASLELENSFSDQLEAKKYLEELIKAK